MIRFVEGVTYETPFRSASAGRPGCFIYGPDKPEGRTGHPLARSRDSVSVPDLFGLLFAPGWPTGGWLMSGALAAGACLFLFFVLGYHNRECFPHQLRSRRIAGSGNLEESPVLRLGGYETDQLLALVRH